MTLITRHGAYIRGALLAFVSGVLPLLTNIVAGQRLTPIDYIAAFLSGVVSLAAFADKTNAKIGATAATWIRGGIYVVSAILTNLLALLTIGKPLTWAVIVAASIPAVNLVIRQYMDKSLTLSKTPLPAVAMLAAPLPSPEELATAGAAMTAAANAAKLPRVPVSERIKAAAHAYTAPAMEPDTADETGGFPHA